VVLLRFSWGIKALQRQILWSDAGFSSTSSLFMSHYALVHWLEALGWIGKASEGI